VESTLSSPSNVKLILIGFNGVIREGLIAILSKDKSIEVVGAFEDGYEALTQLHGAVSGGVGIDVVLTETRGSKVDGVQVTRMLTESFPHVSVLVLTEYDNDSNVIDAIHAGAGGFLFLKELQPEVLIQSIHRVMQGGTQIQTDLLRRAVDDLINNGRKTLAERTAEGAHLSPREVDVLRLMGNGDANKDIASALTITIDTVKKHVQSVITKLGARSRTHASIIAAQAGILGKPVTNGIELPEDEPAPGAGN
jgi:DNA-binding NarL/FixJ family response regulator